MFEWLSDAWNWLAEPTPSGIVPIVPENTLPSRGTYIPPAVDAWSTFGWDYYEASPGPGAPVPSTVPRLPPATFAPGALDIFAPEILVTAKRNPALGAPMEGNWFEDALAWSPAGADTWTNVFAGDTIGGKAFPSSDPLGVYDALKYSASPWASALAPRLPSLAPAASVPRFSVPTLAAPASNLSAWIVPLALAAGAVLLLRK